MIEPALIDYEGGYMIEPALRQQVPWKSRPSSTQGPERTAVDGVAPADDIARENRASRGHRGQ
jgi:hypothetical protein